MQSKLFLSVGSRVFTDKNTQRQFIAGFVWTCVPYNVYNLFSDILCDGLKQADNKISAPGVANDRKN